MSPLSVNSSSTIIQHLQHRWGALSLAHEIGIILAFNALVIISAQVAIPLPFSPVPITGQTFGVLLTAMALGRVRGTSVIALYLLEGIAGLPVFAAGAGGVWVMYGATGGYLFGFLAAAFVVGGLADRGWDRGYLKSLTTLTVGTALIFACGLLWLSRFVEGDALLTLGLMPFVPGAIYKILAAFWIAPKVDKLKRD
jgi:biotin transport system substrate-specific component